MTRYYARGADFLEPEVNIQLGDKYTTGQTAGEFPLLYYSVGQIWKVFGESYLSYRVFYLIILFFGVFCFYKSVRLLFKDHYWAVILAGLLFTSPVLVVYGVSFLTDVPAFCFVLIALYFLLRYHLEQTRMLFWIAMLFFAFGGLVKISSMVAFVFLFFILFIETLGVKTLRTKKVFRCSWMEWIGFIAVVLALMAWYVYAAHYNNVHKFKYTFNDIYPLWNPEEGGIPVLWKKITMLTSHVFYSRYMIFLMGGLLLFHLFLWKRIPLFAYLTTIIVSIGVFIYILLWGPLLGVHDYYFAALLVLFPGILLPFMWFIKTRFPKAFSGYVVKGVAALFLVYNFIYCINVVKLKTRAQEGDFPIVGNEEFVGTMRWLNWDADANWMRFERIKPYLLQIGVGKEDRIISLPDQSFNVSLFLADRKGWTNFETLVEPEKIDMLISRKGAKYLLISDPALLEQSFIQPFITEKIGEFENIRVYRLSPGMLN